MFLVPQIGAAEGGYGGLVTPTSTLVRRVVHAASRLRGERIIHAKGAAFEARLQILDGADRLGTPLVRVRREHRGVVRFSRGAGLPDALPDVLGLALRVFDADGRGGVQDLLLSSSRSPRLLRHLPVPRRDLLRSVYSSLTPYDVDGRQLLVGTCAEADGALCTAALPGRSLLLATATVDGAWEPFSRLVVGSPLAEGRDIDFSIGNCAGGFVPVGPFRDMRIEAYPESRAVESPAAQRR